MKPKPLLFFLLSLLFSCDRHDAVIKTQQTNFKEDEFKGNVVPQKILKPPSVVLQDTVPTPQHIEVPTKAGSSYIAEGLEKGRKIDLMPPQVRPAGIHYFIENFSTEQGLPIDSIACSTMDTKGNLWFGTFGGVSKYDGKSFTNYTTTQGLGFTICKAILEDKLGNLWFGMDGGLSKYDGISFAKYTTDEGLGGNLITAIYEDKLGYLWFGTENGASKYDGKSFVNLTKDQGLVSNVVLSIVEDNEGNLWFGTDNGVSKYNGRSFINYTKEEGLPNNRVNAILNDKKGNLWFCTYGGGVSKYDGTSFTNYTIVQGLANNHVNSIFMDINGHLWFGTDGGASEYDGKSFVNYTKEQGMADKKVMSILEDEGRNLWFGIYLGGLSRYNGKFLTYYTTEQGLPNNSIPCILEDKSKNLWFGTEGGGICKYDGKSFIVYTVNQGLVNDFMYAIFEDKIGNLWFGTSGGLSKFDGKSFTNFTTTQGLPDNNINSILEDKDGKLWIGSAGGLSKFDGKSFTTFKRDQGLSSNVINHLILDRMGNIWIATGDKGISKFDGKSFTNYTVENGLGNDSVLSILEDKIGNLWISTHGGGLSRYDGKSFVTYTQADGLPDDAIYFVMVTKDEDLAIGTNAGIAILKGFSEPFLQKSASGNNENNAPVKISAQNDLKNEELKNYSPVFEIFNVKTGYPLKDMQGGQDGMILDSQGRIWAGTGSNKFGLICLDFSALYRNKKTPNVFLQDVKIDNEEIIWYDLIKNKNEAQNHTLNTSVTLPPNMTEEAIALGKVLSDAERKTLHQRFGDIKFDGITKFYYVPKNLELPYKNNNISFNFVAIDTDFPQNVLYKFILEGNDKNWASPKNKTSATYGNLFEGNYQFKVKAKRTYSDWSEPITYTFTVLPPWFRTWWAYTLYASSTLAFLYLIYRWRTATLRERQRQLEVLYHAAERFVPKRFLQLLNREHMEDVQLGDSVKREITAMFADIRGFTTIAESLTPERTALFLNTYMQYIEPLIREHNGFINQFLGDGILALFPENPSDSIEAALAMLQILPRFNDDVVSKGFSPITVGIGINTGEAMVFALGVKERMDASVVSDAINTASRIEGLNKFYKTQLLISEAVFQQLAHPEKYLIRLVDKVVLKGKKVGMGIYEVLPPIKESLENKLRYITLFNEAFDLYTKGDFSHAESAFQLCLKQNPDDAVAQLLLSRCIEFQKTGGPKNWNGTIVLLEK